MDSMANLEAGASNYGSVEGHKYPVNHAEKHHQSKIYEATSQWFMALVNLVLPLSIFLLNYYVLSFYPHYWSSYLGYGISILLLLVCSAFGVMALAATRGKGGDPLCLGLLCTLCLIGWIWSFLYANANYFDFMQPYYDLQQLNVYANVDPAASSGNQYMDFGILGFVNVASVDRKLSMAFRNGHTYCAAPLRVNKTAPAAYDFWAVGVDCCTSQYDFNCIKPNAHSGLRVTQEHLRSFYQLTVNQAAAAHNIPVNNPVYFEMVADPSVEINALQDEGLRSFLTAAFGFLCLQAVVVFFVAVVFSKA